MPVTSYLRTKLGPQEPEPRQIHLDAMVLPLDIPEVSHNRQEIVGLPPSHFLQPTGVSSQQTVLASSPPRYAHRFNSDPVAIYEPGSEDVFHVMARLSTARSSGSAKVRLDEKDGRAVLVECFPSGLSSSPSKPRYDSEYDTDMDAASIPRFWRRPGENFNRTTKSPLLTQEEEDHISTIDRDTNLSRLMAQSPPPYLAETLESSPPRLGLYNPGLLSFSDSSSDAFSSLPSTPLNIRQFGGEFSNTDTETTSSVGAEWTDIESTSSGSSGSGLMSFVSSEPPESPEYVPPSAAIAYISAGIQKAMPQRLNGASVLRPHPNESHDTCPESVIKAAPLKIRVRLASTKRAQTRTGKETKSCTRVTCADIATKLKVEKATTGVATKSTPAKVIAKTNAPKAVPKSRAKTVTVTSAKATRTPNSKTSTKSANTIEPNNPKAVETKSTQVATTAQSQPANPKEKSALDRPKILRKEVFNHPEPNMFQPGDNAKTRMELYEAASDELKEAASKKLRGVQACGDACPSQHSTIFEMIEHMNDCHDRQFRNHLCPYPDCPWSIAGFHKAIDARRHIASLHAAPRFQCPVRLCRRRFARHDSCIRHQKTCGFKRFMK